MKTLPVLLLSLEFLTASLASAQSDAVVDWTQTALTLTILNDQILDWQQRFEDLSSQPVTPETLTAILKLHFQKGPIVVQGFKALQDLWKNRASDSEKKSRYLAVSHYFAGHSVDLGGSWAWDWYRCFSPPLSSRYNDLAADAELPPVPSASSDEHLLDALSAADRKALFQICRPTITDFLGRNGYPLFEDKIARMGFASQGVVLLGSYPKNRSQLNADFTFPGSPLFLFGMGL